MDEICAEVEAAHDAALSLRRRRLTTSVSEAARAAGLSVDELAHDQLLVTGGSTRTVVLVTPRLPHVEDLHELDRQRNAVASACATDGLLVHAGRRLSTGRRDVLEWARCGRDLVMLPDHAVGGYW